MQHSSEQQRLTMWVHSVQPTGLLHGRISILRTLFINLSLFKGLKAGDSLRLSIFVWLINYTRMRFLLLIVCIAGLASCKDKYDIEKYYSKTEQDSLVTD